MIRKTLPAVFLDALFPPRCIVCGRSDRRAEAIPGFCVPCLSALPHRRAPERMVSVPGPTGPDLKVLCATRYEGAMNRLLTRYKFHGETGWHRALSALLVRILSDAMRSGILQADAVAAVPLHPARRRERGYNQSEFLASDVAEHLGISDVSSALTRVVNTRRQTETNSRSARFANVSRAFAVTDPPAVFGRSVLLVDDILTTGATLLACRDAVLCCHPAAVTGAVLSSRLQARVLS